MRIPIGLGNAGQVKMLTSYNVIILSCIGPFFSLVDFKQYVQGVYTGLCLSSECATLTFTACPDANEMDTFVWNQVVERTNRIATTPAHAT